ncbi:MAG: WecB/TagA/CpsF family glycosyltransferase [Candidatus Ruminococcus intestinipullorum]|nr:WecB/TagA/CpsF family glycosyltransferase [Candidatus Ruminococcus intestinipullorum]
MESKIQILDVELDKLCAKEVMKRAVQYMSSESINTIEIMTMDMMLRSQETPKWDEAVKKLDLVIPGEVEILEAAEIMDKSMIRDVSNQIFLKMFLRYLQRNKKRIFLVAPSRSALVELESAITLYDRHLILVGHGILSKDGKSNENVINEINGAEVDCILSILPSPEQELFIQENSALLNARIWFGCGDVLKENYMKKNRKGWIRRFFRKKIFRYLVGQHKKNEEV